MDVSEHDELSKFINELILKFFGTFWKSQIESQVKPAFLSNFDLYNDTDWIRLLQMLDYCKNQSYSEKLDLTNIALRGSQ